MNFVFVSPNYPVRYFKWVESLRNRGMNVLGIGDTPFQDLHPRLKAALNEYYFVSNMNDHGQMDAAVGYFQNKYGPIDFIESMNEWWLEEDARLREKFGVTTGFHPADMRHIKAKSAMKEYFARAGAKTMRYLVVSGPQDKEKALEFVKKVGFPVFVKPDVGVGATESYSLKTPEDFDRFFSHELPEPYIMEEFVNGRIVSFDGICDSKGDVVFATTDHFPVPIDHLVNEGLDHVYFDIPFGLEMTDVDADAFYKTGCAVVKSFGIKRRFFHIEFFVLNEDKPGFAKKDEFVALECNMRAPGGYTPDLINYGNSVSGYEIYADIMAYDENRQNMDLPKYYAVASHRRYERSYVHSVDEIYRRYGSCIKTSGAYTGNIAAVMGNWYVFACFLSYQEAVEFDEYVRAKN